MPDQLPEGFIPDPPATGGGLPEGFIPDAPTPGPQAGGPQMNVAWVNGVPVTVTDTPADLQGALDYVNPVGIAQGVLQMGLGGAEVLGGAVTGQPQLTQAGLQQFAPMKAQADEVQKAAGEAYAWAAANPDRVSSSILGSPLSRPSTSAGRSVSASPSSMIDSACSSTTELSGGGHPRHELERPVE